MSVVIDDVPYPRFPITPREGLVLTIGGQKRVIDRIEVSLDTLEIRCETRSLLDAAKEYIDARVEASVRPLVDEMKASQEVSKLFPQEKPPSNTNAEEPESDANGKAATAEEVSRGRSSGGGSIAPDGNEMSKMRSGEAVVSVGKAPRRQGR